MEARTRKDGQITYRFHPLLADGTRGKPINLGTDKALAIRQVLDMASRASDQGTILWPALAPVRAVPRLHPPGRRHQAPVPRVLEAAGQGVRARHRRRHPPADVARYLRVERTTTAAIARTGCARLWRG
jgi:hypothetical protein